MNSSILNTGTKYLIKYPRCNVFSICKLIAKHEASLSHQKLYTFTDEYGNKIIITNGVFKSIIIKEYEEEPTIIQIMDMALPSKNNNEDDLYS
jgi:hypothetical protein